MTCHLAKKCVASAAVVVVVSSRRAVATCLRGSHANNSRAPVDTVRIKLTQTVVVVVRGSKGRRVRTRTCTIRGSSEVGDNTGRLIPVRILITALFVDFTTDRKIKTLKSILASCERSWCRGIEW